MIPQSPSLCVQARPWKPCMLLRPSQVVLPYQRRVTIWYQQLWFVGMSARASLEDRSWRRVGHFHSGSSGRRRFGHSARRSLYLVYSLGFSRLWCWGRWLWQQRDILPRTLIAPFVLRSGGRAVWLTILMSIWSCYHLSCSDWTSDPSGFARGARTCRLCHRWSREGGSRGTSWARNLQKIAKCAPRCDLHPSGSFPQPEPSEELRLWGCGAKLCGTANVWCTWNIKIGGGSRDAESTCV